jgi:hypothetical protein
VPKALAKDVSAETSHAIASSAETSAPGWPAFTTARLPGRWRDVVLIERRSPVV